MRRGPGAAPGPVGRAVVWLNGTFGAGKTTTAVRVARLVPGARVFDTELVGEMLAKIPGLPDLGDFQHWPPWRHLVVETAAQLLGYVGGTLVVPQSVLVQRYWDEIAAGLAAVDIEVHHYVLHADRDTLTRRIVHDGTHTDHGWRLRHLPAYEAALGAWLAGAGQLVDTTGRQPEDVARVVAEDATGRPGAAPW
ncbi:ATP-binding protein [Streptomyces marispadix]|uniref:ATP-binding protein n=1 Tax=Streptomyces marispadix TaxID=2922868 RepID=A0ABS9SZC1_9ACTN|nr:ATP-binding protein [Streptomyces marispadix]MCH6161625.1 ATP-binding protein [Streptomyces marispadix]